MPQQHDAANEFKMTPKNHPDDHQINPYDPDTESFAPDSALMKEFSWIPAADAAVSAADAAASAGSIFLNDGLGNRRRRRLGGLNILY